MKINNYESKLKEFWREIDALQEEFENKYNEKEELLNIIGDCYTELRSLYEKFDDQMSDEDYELLVRIKEVLNKEYKK